MAPRKNQSRGSSSLARGGRRKRARRDSSQDDSEFPSQSQLENELGTAANVLPTVISWSDTLHQFETTDMISQRARYKQWRRDGSKNETTCRICLQPGTVLPCRTCRVAFHTGCVPENSLSEPDSLSLYCSICVQRGWHLSPPELTPPASPVLGPIQQPQVDRPPATPVSAPSTMPSSNPVGATSISEPTGPSTTPQAPQEDSGNAAQRHTDIPQNSLGVNVNPTDDIVTESSAPKRKRKSRFATLSSEVDESLSVLYRELESITSLKMQIIDLRNESIHQNQMIRLRDNKIAILERDLQQRKSAENELAELRANNSQHESIKTELEALRVKVAALESELQESRNETATAQDLVNDWKGKLAQLLNT